MDTSHQIRTFDTVDEFAEAAGQRLGTSPWHEVTQEQIDMFADATGDYQWIHVDRERAQDGPFGTTIAHGFLSLSLLPRFHRSIFLVHNKSMGMNYGLEKVRFPAPVPAGSLLRGTSDLLDARPAPGGRGTRFHLRTTVEIQGSAKPACVAEPIILYLPSRQSVGD